jgi:hypothetical protein
MSTRYIARDRNIGFVSYYLLSFSLSTGTGGYCISLKDNLCNMWFVTSAWYRSFLSQRDREAEDERAVTSDCDRSSPQLWNMGCGKVFGKICKLCAIASFLLLKSGKYFADFGEVGYEHVHSTATRCEYAPIRRSR